MSTTNCPELENHIPLCKDELIEVLASDQSLTESERQSFRTFCRLVGTMHHHNYSLRLDKLKAAYQPFDADADTRPLFKPGGEEKQQKMNTLFKEVSYLLEEADYKHLSREEIEPGLARASAWGLRVVVDFGLFERLAIFARGDIKQKRKLRRLSKALRSEELDVPIYQRVVMILKMKPSRHGRSADTENVFLQLFKNIPKLDINMLLPGARARLSFFDRCKIVLPIVMGLTLTAWQIAYDVVSTTARSLAEYLPIDHAVIVWVVASSLLGYGLRSYFGYQQTKQSYNLSLSQVLFYQNLDTNAGVLFRLLDEAEEQDVREAILGYFGLWRSGGEKGWTSADLENHVEQDLKTRTNLQIDFEDDCLLKLEKLGVVEKSDERYRALPLDQAIEILETRCETCFRPPIPTSSAPSLEVTPN